MTMFAALPATWTPVTSKAVEGVAWEDDVLFVAFRNATYAYFGVPADLFAMLLASESVGQFVNSVIKGEFEFERIV